MSGRMVPGAQPYGPSTLDLRPFSFQPLAQALDAARERGVCPESISVTTLLTRAGLTPKASPISRPPSRVSLRAR